MKITTKRFCFVKVKIEVSTSMQYQEDI